MVRPRSANSTFGRDPLDAVIPRAEPGPAHGDGESPRPARRRGRPRAIRPEPPATQDRQDAGPPVEEGGEPAGHSTPGSPRAERVRPAQQAAGRRKQKLTVHLDEDLVNRVKNAAYWNPRLNIARIAERGIRRALDEVERENGGPYEQRESELPGGRPMR